MAGAYIMISSLLTDEDLSYHTCMSHNFIPKINLHNKYPVYIKIIYK